MNRARICFASILTFLLFSTAQATDEETAADVRCLVVGIQMSRSLDTTQQTSGVLVAMFYFGRLDRIVPEPKLEGLIAKVTSEMTTANIRADAARCGKSLTEKGKLLQQIGNELTLRNPKQRDKTTPPSQ